MLDQTVLSSKTREGTSAFRRTLGWVGVRWGALANPARREGWWKPKQALPTLGVSAVTALQALDALHAESWRSL